MKERGLVFFIGLIAVLVLLEISLRILGAVHLKRKYHDKDASSGNNTCYTIACLGDSFTFGEGSSYGRDYPSQLEELLNAKAREDCFRVVNRGMPGKNTSQIVKNERPFLNKEEPDLVVLLMGSSNEWNYWGYHDYLKGESFLSMLQNQLYEIRIYKMIKLLILNVRRKGVEDGPRGDMEDNLGTNKKRENEKFHREELQNITDEDMADAEKEHPEKIGSYKDRIKKEPNDSRNYNHIGDIFRAQGKYEEAIKWMREAIRVNPERSESYNSLGWIYIKQGEYEEAEKQFREAIKRKPEFSESYNGLGVIYESRGKHREAVEYYKKAIELDPCELDSTGGHTSRTISNYADLARIYIELGEFSEAKRFLETQMERCPLAADYYEIIKNTKNIEKEKCRWIEYDLKQIIQICKKNKIKIMLQNYPTNRAVTRMIDLDLGSFSKSQSIPLVDNRSVFNELFSKGARKEDYFVPDGHCNDRGYGVIAKNIYDKIIEEKYFELE